MHFHHCYKKLKKIGILFFILLFLYVGINIDSVDAYYFGLKSADNTPMNIKMIEDNLKIKLPIVSFIFDPREESNVLNSIDEIIDILGKDRIYHFTVSPNNFSANEVRLGKFDAQYLAFFEKIKEKDLHVIFRTMHEMNGGRYPWASNPKIFKEAWIHVWSLSRSAGLDESNIVFDFSVNHWDMPTKGIPSQSATLVECPIWKKGCYHFEDYYPGDDFVDVVGFTFYNRGKAVENRMWLSPHDILYDSRRKTYSRLQALKKPIIIDEVATTSVRYKGNYNYTKSRNVYLSETDRKNYRLRQLWEFIIERPEIVAVIYFNCDYTDGLKFKVKGEADRPIIDIEDGKIYEGFRDLELFGEKKLTNILSSLFHLDSVTIEGQNVFIPHKCSKDFSIISSFINDKKDKTEKIAMITKLQNIKSKSECTSQSLKILSDIYNK